MAAADRLLLLQKIDQVALLIGMEQLVYWKQIAFNYDKKWDVNCYNCWRNGLPSPIVQFSAVENC